MAAQTIQLTIPQKYQQVFDTNSLLEKIVSFEDFLAKLGIDKHMIDEIAYIKHMKNDIQNKRYTSSHKLGRTIK